jgi:hypothetical protein
MELEINSLKASTVNIIDYRLKSETLAKVLISFTGEHTGESLTESLCNKLKNGARPVQSSFKIVKPGLAVGFLRSNRAVIALPTRTELGARYRVMSSNIYLDSTDKSLWEVKNGSAGKYLARHGQEDLTALVEATVQRRTDLPGLRHVTMAKAAKNEMVAFVTDDGSMDYGIALQGSDDSVRVMSVARHIPVTASYDQVVSMSAIRVPASVDKEIRAALTPEEKKTEADYWRKLYSYSPDYVAQIIEQVNQGTVL